VKNAFGILTVISKKKIGRIIMKKTIAAAFAAFMLLFAGATNAREISSTNDSGHTGDPVQLYVSLDTGDITDGGDFTIGYDSTKLTFVDIVGRNDSDYSFLPFFIYPFYNSLLPWFDDPRYSGVTVDFAYLGAIDPASAPIDSIFSILFNIIEQNPSLTADDYTYVYISEVLLDPVGEAGELKVLEVSQTFKATVTILAPETGNVPEPGILGLVGLALLIMTAAGRRVRVNRG
jgi:hypothetical protein